MTLERLRIFVAVAERDHVTAAARALNLTQSAVSNALAALEAEHQVRLFDRVGRGVALNATGRAFLPEAKAVLARAAAAEAALADLSALRRGRLAVFASQTIASYWLPRRLVDFHTAHPGVELDVQIGNTREVAQAVLNGAAEIGLVEGVVDAPALTQVQVGSDRLAVVVTPDHPWAFAKRLSAGDLVEIILGAARTGLGHPVQSGGGAARGGRKSGRSAGRHDPAGQRGGPGRRRGGRGRHSPVRKRGPGLGRSRTPGPGAVFPARTPLPSAAPFGPLS